MAAQPLVVAPSRYGAAAPRTAMVMSAGDSAACDPDFGWHWIPRGVFNGHERVIVIPC
jgi:hypothetical protein